MTIFPCPTFPLAMHSTFGQNCVEAFICSSVVFCIDIVYRCLPLFQVAPASPPPVNAPLPLRFHGEELFVFFYESRTGTQPVYLKNRSTDSVQYLYSFPYEVHKAYL